MYILMKELYDELNRHSKILIYGAGYYANIIYQKLKKAGLKNKIASFLVTDPNETGIIDEIHVEAASALALYDKEDIAILIAVSRKNEKEIIETLKTDYGIEHGIKLFDYIMQDENTFFDQLGQKTDECFLENLIEYYIWNHLDSGEELNRKREESITRIEKRDIEGSDNNTIVFISGDLKPRSEKIIAALVGRNYHVIVLEYGYAYCSKLVRKEIASLKVEIFSCETMMDVFYQALQYKPLVYYFEPMWGDCKAPEIMIRHKALFGKVVFAPYDVLNDALVQIPDADKQAERYCLENADGIVWRWFSKKFLEEKKGFVYKGKSIQFLDYCKGFEMETDLDFQSDDVLKICFVQGGIYQLLDQPVLSDDDIYAEPAKLDAILKIFGNRSDCLFHMFIGWCDDNVRQKLDRIEEKYCNIKFFYEVEYHQLIHTISKYDYGSFLMTAGKKIPDQKSIDHVYYGSVYINSIANRFFDYLDAGIPIIGTYPEKQCAYLDQYGVIVKMNTSDLDIDYLKKNKLLYREKVKKANHELRIENHIQRLIDWFYRL